MKMGASGTAALPNVANQVAAADALPHDGGEAGQVAITSANAVAVFEL